MRLEATGLFETRQFSTQIEPEFSPELFKRFSKFPKMVSALCNDMPVKWKKDSNISKDTTSWETLSVIGLTLILPNNILSTESLEILF